MKNQEAEQMEAEYIPHQTAEEPMPLLKIDISTEVAEKWMERTVAGCALAVEWAEKMVVDSHESRDQARRERQAIRSAQSLLDKNFIEFMRPADEKRDELSQVRNNIKARLQVAVDLYDKKGVAYNQECARLEAEQKAKALAAQRAEEERIAAERRQREAEEEKLRAQEAEKIARLKAEAQKKAKAEGDKATAKLQAEEAAKAEVARIEGERAAREKAERDRQAAEEAEKDRVHAQTMGAMGNATALGRQKGVRKIWIIEIINEKHVPREFCTYDPAKSRGYLQTGAFTETDPLKIIPGLRCYQSLKSSGR